MRSNTEFSPESVGAQHDGDALHREIDVVQESEFQIGGNVSDDFRPVPPDITFAQGIEMLKKGKRVRCGKCCAGELKLSFPVRLTQGLLLHRQFAIKSSRTLYPVPGSSLTGNKSLAEKPALPAR